jgi:hypothetical protein
MFWRRRLSDILPDVINVSNLNSEKWKNAKTYNIDFEKKRIVGKRDELIAMKQAIYKALKTKRYEYEIYDWNYGSEIDSLIGKSMSYGEEHIEEYIKEALLTDKRILSIEDVEIERGRNTLNVSFVAKTIFGDTSQELEVDI